MRDFISKSRLSSIDSEKPQGLKMRVKASVAAEHYERKSQASKAGTNMNTINTDEDGLEILDLEDMTEEQRKQNVKIQNILRHRDSKETDGGKLNLKINKK